MGDNDIYGEDALKYTILSVYTKRDDPEGFKKQFGCDLYELDENGNPKFTSSGNKELNGMAASAVADYIDNIQGDEAHFESEYGITSYGVANSLDHYLEERGVDCDVELEYRSTYDSNDVQQAIDDGKTIISGQSEFNLYNEDGTEYYGNPVGGHHMTITGVNEDGDYISFFMGR